MTTRRRFLVPDRTPWLGQPSQLLSWPHKTLRPRQSSIRIGSCRIDIGEAKQAGLDGVEVRVGDPAERLEIADPHVLARYHEQMRQTGLPIRSLMMGLLNKCPLATDPRAPSWLEQSIDSARDLGADVILIAFFGKGDLLTPDGEVKQDDVDVVIRSIEGCRSPCPGSRRRLGSRELSRRGTKHATA